LISLKNPKGFFNPHSKVRYANFFSTAAGSISSVGVGYNPPPIDRQLCSEKKFAKRICFYLATLNDGASPLLNDGASLLLNKSISE